MYTNVDMLIFGAHPDDAEIGMGGTIAKHTAADVRIGVCDLTAAELSSNGTVELRKQEAEEARKVLNISCRSNLGLPDRGLERTETQLAAITAEIRRTRPKIVFAPYWEDRHPDHVACSKLVEEAVFNAKLRRYMPELPPITIDKVYYYFINDIGKTDLLVDVTGVYEQKLQALSCYRSQFVREFTDESIFTPLNHGYVERVKSRDSLTGHRYSIPFAEGFAVKAPLVVDFFVK